jgi:photosystem II stability/assembly factor-like uncharacterized protein
MTEEVPARATVPNIAEANTWIGIGPWVNINALVIDPVTPSILYAGTDGGLFKSTNGGESWNAINSGLGDYDILDLAIDPVTPTTIYAAVAFHTLAGGGVFKSMDGGNSWSAARKGLPNYVSKLAIDPLTPTTLYAVTFSEGVYKSTNGGESWRAANKGLSAENPALVLAIDPAMPGTLYLGTYSGGVFKSTDSGGNWSAVNTGIDLNTEYENAVDKLVIVPATPSTVFAVTRYRGVFKSTDGGQDWTAFDIGPVLPYAAGPLLMPDLVSPATLYLIKSVDEIYKSTDGGIHCEAYSSTGLLNNSPNLFITVLAIDPMNTNILYLGTHGGGIFTNQTNKAFAPVKMPSITPPPMALTEDPFAAIPAPTEAPIDAIPIPTDAPYVPAPTQYIAPLPTETLSARSTLAPLQFPFTVTGPLNYRKDIQLPENARLLVLWFVIAEDPQYIYTFGEGSMDPASNSFELVFDGPPPSHALNWMGSSALGVGLLVITTNQALQTGTISPEFLPANEILGVSAQYSIIYANNGFEIGEYMPWFNEFNPGYSVGKGVDVPDSAFDAFEPVDPWTLEIIIDDLEKIALVNWF